MAGNALVVRGRLHVDPQPLGRIGGVDHDGAGPRAVCQALVVLRARVRLGAERLHLLDLDALLRKVTEQRRQLLVHLRDVLVVAIEDVLAVLGVELLVGLDRLAQRREVLEPELARELRLDALDARDLVEPDLVNLVGAQVRRGGLANCGGVARLAVG